MSEWISPQLPKIISFKIFNIQDRTQLLYWFLETHFMQTRDDDEKKYFIWKSDEKHGSNSWVTKLYCWLQLNFKLELKVFLVSMLRSVINDDSKWLEDFSPMEVHVFVLSDMY